jgi:hypothetical protein
MEETIMSIRKSLEILRFGGILIVSACAILGGSPHPVAAQSTQIKTEYLMTLYAPLAPPQVVGDLRIFNIREGGYAEGPRIKGKIIQPAGDWNRRMPDGTSRMDVRGTIQTDDNAFIYVEYVGVAKLSKEATDRLGKGETLGSDDGYFMITLRFQTSSAKYAWVNELIAVGRMVSLKGGDHIKYEIFSLR